MVKVNRIANTKNRRTLFGIILILATAAIGTILWENRPPASLRDDFSIEGNWCELPTLTAVSADGCPLRLKIWLEPQNRAETATIRAQKREISANIVNGLKQHHCRALSPDADPQILHQELRKQIDRAIAPLTIKNIRFSRLSK